MKSKVNGFVEVLSGIIRLGPECYEYGDPYQFAVAFSTDEGVAVIKALVSDGDFTWDHAAAIRRILKEYGLKPKFHRQQS